MTILHAKTFYIVRHGQTTDNEAGLISGGGRDPNLTDLGRQQAGLAAQIFAALDPIPSRIVVSGLVRTHQTAWIITGHNKHVIDVRINERYLGDLDGLISEEEQIRRKILPGEESPDDQRARVVEAVNHHLSEEGSVLFVCHGGTVRRILEATNLKGRVEAHNGIIYRIFPTDGGWDVSQPV
jgi:broad specificity phosphatase PhoE